ncbi:hypothetical protein SAMN04489716_7136 [Actinoplanes derwentensis]|uniref:Peptidase inhibitor family I36 n=2 Tax=Actinoplanes derwentensis TaxID=113562 RepID=A0A1H2CXA4_9ACTN|nr:hypothetical protein Ade03nite_68100 [Actinoplanes derwentensis]SDT74917.1 hypothetical protein SAMN04489716_7136 [Actinoplanes derwentensis]
MAVLAAATMFAGMQAGPALGMPEAAGQPSDCIPVNDSCVYLSQITENTPIYIVDGPGGEVQGYDDFSQYVQVLRSYGVAISSNGQSLSVSGGGYPTYPPEVDPTYPPEVDPTYPPEPEEQTYPTGEEETTYPPEEEEPTYPTGEEETTYPPEEEEGPYYSFARVAQSAEMSDFVSFFDQSNYSGPSFSVGVGGPHDLAAVQHPNGGTWSRRISSFIASGGSPTKPGVVLCAKFNCSKAGWVRTFKNGTEMSLAPQGGLPAAPFNNAARGVIVLK